MLCTCNVITVIRADRVFNLLDKDDSGQLAADEFVNGVLSIQGGAKSVDISSKCL